MEELFTKLDMIGCETEDAIERFMGDEEVYLQYLTTFNNDQTFEKIKNAANEKDFKQLEIEVHTLKGVSANLGLVPIMDAAMDALHEIRSNNQEEAIEEIKEVEKNYNKVTKIIQNWKEDNDID